MVSKTFSKKTFSRLFIYHAILLEIKCIIFWRTFSTPNIKNLKLEGKKHFLFIINRKNPKQNLLNRAFFISLFNMKILNPLESCKALLSFQNKFRQIHKQLPINVLTHKISDFGWRMAQLAYTKSTLQKKGNSHNTQHLNSR